MSIWKINTFHYAKKVTLIFRFYKVQNDDVEIKEVETEETNKHQSDSKDAKVKKLKRSRAKNLQKTKGM